jgi:hypothetical protein
MPKTKLFDKKEMRSIIIGALVLGFVFSFREWGYGEVNVSIGIVNLIRSAILSFIVLLIYQSSHKLIARKYGANSTFRLWGLNRYWFVTKAKIENMNFFGKKFKRINMGVTLPILLALLSNGVITFGAVGSSEVTEVSRRLIGKKHRYLTEYELGKIHLVGPLTILLFSLIIHQFQGFGSLVQISYTIALFSMIPFSGLDGAKVFFGSIPLYILGAGFMLATVILMQIVSPIWTLILAGVIAFILLTLFLHKTR